MTGVVLDHVIWASQEAEVVTGGKSTSPWFASGVCLSMADVQPGDLFVAARGDNVAEAVARGASALMGPENLVAGFDVPALIVDDSYEALRCLARAARYRTHAHVVAVQGMDARHEMHALMQEKDKVHFGGKHVSSGLASMPDDAHYAVFPLSPIVKPDIAVIADPSAHFSDSLFGAMSEGGAILINADNGCCVDVLARVKACGVEHVYFYSVRGKADICLNDIVDLPQGRMYRVDVCGHAEEFFLPHGKDIPSMLLPMLMIRRMTGRRRQSHELLGGLNNMPVPEVSARCGNVSMFPTSQVQKTPEGVFRVQNMIDFGRLRQTAVLDCFGASEISGDQRWKSHDWSAPLRSNALDFMYTPRKASLVENARATIKQKMGRVAVEEISSEVLTPGDFVVFKNIWQGTKTLVTEALRVIPETQRIKIKTN